MSSGWTSFRNRFGKKQDEAASERLASCSEGARGFGHAGCRSSGEGRADHRAPQRRPRFRRPEERADPRPLRQPDRPARGDPQPQGGFRPPERAGVRPHPQLSAAPVAASRNRGGAPAGDRDDRRPCAGSSATSAAVHARTTDDLNAAVSQLRKAESRVREQESYHRGPAPEREGQGGDRRRPGEPARHRDRARPQHHGREPGPAPRSAGGRPDGRPRRAGAHRDPRAQRPPRPRGQAAAEGGRGAELPPLQPDQPLWRARDPARGHAPARLRARDQAHGRAGAAPAPRDADRLRALGPPDRSLVARHEDRGPELASRRRPTRSSPIPATSCATRTRPCAASSAA